MRIENLRIMNAAGWCKEQAHVELLARSPATEITVGSITVPALEINPGNVFYVTEDGTSQNTLGLPNKGSTYYREALPLMVASAHHANKKLRLSIAGFSPAEFGELAILGEEAGADVIELNLGCPNVWGENGQKPIAAYSPDLMHEILALVSRICKRVEIEVKVSPYEPGLLKKIAEVIISAGCVRSVITANTFPNSIIYGHQGRPVITFQKGYAGLAGTALKPIVLGQVMQFREHLPPHIGITAAGGIASGRDVREYCAAGADSYQIGTALFKNEDPRIFVHIFEELADSAA